MNDELVERLRDADVARCKDVGIMAATDIYRLAADTIERLRADNTALIDAHLRDTKELDRLRAALDKHHNEPHSYRPCYICGEWRSDD